MKSDWKEYTVQELIDLEMLDEPLDGNHGSIHPKAADYVDSGVPFIMANNLIDGIVDLDGCAFISEAQAKTLRKGFAKPGDVLLTHKATIGRTAIVPNRCETIVLTPQVTYYRVKKGIDNRYLKYYFDSHDFQVTLNNWAGSGSTRAYIGITAQRKLPVILPPYSVQRKIADILEVFDKKISINNGINENLLQQAQNVFFQEFLSLESIPDSWQENSLLGIADYLNGLAMQKYRPKDDEQGLPVLKIKELRQGFCDSNSELCSPSIKSEYIVHDGDVIFSWSGSLLVDFWCGGTCGLNQHLFKVTSPTYDKWFYYAWTKHHLQKFAAIAADMATTMGHIKREELAKAKVLIPSQSDYDRIGGLLDPLYDLVIANRVENHKLAALRDELLPKLMSGQLDVLEVAL
jgi:type I restriction enzyme S subunit